MPLIDIKSKSADQEKYARELEPASAVIGKYVQDILYEA